MSFSVQTAGARRMGAFRIITAFLLLLVGDLALTRAGAAVPAERVSAQQLVRNLDSVLAGAAQAAGPSDPRLTSFRSALERMRLRVGLIEDALARRDEALFLLLDQGSSDLGWLRVAWARAGVKNDQVTAGLRAASASYRFLRSHYGREGLRHRQGGPLSEAERRQFERVQRAQRRFADSLRALRERAQRRDDPTTVAELDRFCGEAERIAWASFDLEAYLNALIAAGEMRGEWEANAPYMRTGAPEEFAAAAETVEDLYVESDIGHVFTLDLGAAGGWSYLDQEAEVPAGEEIAAAPALQIYEPSGREVEPDAAEGPAGPVSDMVVEGDDIGETDLVEGTETGSLADPEDLEETAMELADDGILEEEDLSIEEAIAEEVQADAPAAGETAAVKESSTPAGTEVPQQVSEPAGPESAKPPVAAPPVSPPIG
ncbi:MAG TPA: hypothetical protein VGX68_29120 [Thermoanaerobaculia bacterium]|jgi:hypothetical protein|nr:hypothetical protein [Thermoanaerobaculia bacterium]